jgi:hypothetical protein
MRRINKPTTVELIMDDKGIRRIIHFTWMGKRQPVAGLGRMWTDQAGTHVMVSTADSRIFELLFKPDQSWWVVGAGIEEFLV